MSYYTYYLYKYLVSGRQKISSPCNELVTKCSKLLKSDIVKEILIKSLLGSDVSKSNYPYYDHQCVTDAIFDIIYIPNNKNKPELSPPIAVVVQEVINECVMADLVFYSTRLYQQYKMLPMLLIISMKGFECDRMKTEFGSIRRRHNMFSLRESTSCLYWAQHFYVVTWESIEPFTQTSPMDKLIAFLYCIIHTEEIPVCYQDPT